MCCAFAQLLSCDRFFATAWTVAQLAPLSMRILQARILEWVAMTSSRGDERYKLINIYWASESKGFVLNATCITVMELNAQSSVEEVRNMQCYQHTEPCLHKVVTYTRCQFGKSGESQTSGSLAIVRSYSPVEAITHGNNGLYQLRAVELMGL